MSNNDEMSYPRSGMPSKSGEPTNPVGPREDQGDVVLRSHDAIRGDVLGYPSLENQGLVEIELPSRRPSGSQMVEKMRLCDFGRHVGKQVERDLASSPTEATLTLSWYAGAARGAKLFDNATLAEFGKLVRGFSASQDPEEYFTENVEPFLAGLKPERR